jgi:hypothetical protein
LVAELDAPWAGYVEGLERLTRPDADVALRDLEAQVSKAIMYALENQGILESKVSEISLFQYFCMLVWLYNFVIILYASR